MDREMPPGRRHNPSSRRKRFVIEMLALCGAVLSSYLALYQLGAIHSVWDPIFGSASSAVILHSSFSRSLPVPDALLGVVAYLAELFLSRFGSARRWHDEPWKVSLNAAIALSLVLAAILLVCLQALVYRHGCTVCLGSATLSLAIGLLSADEGIASWRYLAAVSRARGSVLLAWAGKPRQALPPLRDDAAA